MTTAKGTPSHSTSGQTSERAIRAAGLRVTQSRLAVYEALIGMPHARADQVFDRVQQVLPETSLQSVYNALGDFTDARIVRRIEPAGHPSRFELQNHDNHHHLICTACNAIEDIECTIGEAPCHTPSDDHGYLIHEMEVTYWGLCPKCSAATAS